MLAWNLRRGKSGCEAAFEPRLQPRLPTCSFLRSRAREGPPRRLRRGQDGGSSQGWWERRRARQGLGLLGPPRCVDSTPHSWERVRGPAGLQPTQAEAEQAVPTRSLTQWDGSSGHASVAGGGDTGPEGCGDLL